MKFVNSSRKIKSLEYCVEHLKLEIDELTEEMNGYVQKFSQTLYERAEMHVEMHQEQTTQKIDAESSELVNSQVQPEALKKIWKKIAAVTHPDKTGNNPRLTRLYKRAAAAWSSLHAQEILQIATELGLQTPEISHEITIDSLQDLKKNLHQKIHDLENSVLVQWGRASCDEKENIMDFYMKSKGYSRKQCK